MKKAGQVLIVIALAITFLQLGALVVDLLEGKSGSYNDPSGDGAAVRWLVYWFSGVVVASAAFLMRKVRRFGAFALSVAGFCLMLLGNNAGLLSSGHSLPRMITTILTCGGLLVLTLRE